MFTFTATTSLANLLLSSRLEIFESTEGPFRNRSHSFSASWCSCRCRCLNSQQSSHRLAAPCTVCLGLGRGDQVQQSLPLSPRSPTFQLAAGQLTTYLPVGCSGPPTSSSPPPPPYRTARTTALKGLHHHHRPTLPLRASPSL